MKIHTLNHDDDSKKRSRASKSSSNQGTPNDSKTDNTSVSAIWSSFPTVTRSVVVLMFICSSSIFLQLANPALLVFHGYEIFRYRQWWRIITSFMILPPNAMSALMQVYNLGSRSYQLETDRFLVSRYHSPSIDFMFYLTFCAALIITMVCFTYGISESLILTAAFDACLSLTWAIDNASTKMMFYGIIPVYGKFYPFLEGLTTFIFGGDLRLLAIGFIAAYIFNCLDTRTLGPVYGYITGKGPWYGIVPLGKFNAPFWFVWSYEFVFGGNYTKKFKQLKITKKKNDGQRLGSTTVKSSSKSNVSVPSRGAQKLGSSKVDTSSSGATGKIDNDILATHARRRLNASNRE